MLFMVIKNAKRIYFEKTTKKVKENKPFYLFYYLLNFFLETITQCKE